MKSFYKKESLENFQALKKSWKDDTFKSGDKYLIKLNKHFYIKIGYYSVVFSNLEHDFEIAIIKPSMKNSNIFKMEYFYFSKWVYNPNVLKKFSLDILYLWNK